jgi:hypothetical protein
LKLAEPTATDSPTGPSAHEGRDSSPERAVPILRDVTDHDVIGVEVVVNEKVQLCHVNFADYA